MARVARLLVDGVTSVCCDLVIGLARCWAERVAERWMRVGEERIGIWGASEGVHFEEE